MSQQDSQPNPIESEGAELRNPNACKEHQNQPHGQRGCMKCVDAHLEYAVGGESPKPELPNLDNLYQPQITDLELNEHQGNERPVIYLDDAKATVQSLIDEARTEATEIFIPIRGFEGKYEVSNLGNIRSLPRANTKGGILKTASRHTNYQCVSFVTDGVKKLYYVHRLVAENFLSNPEGKRTVNHKDSDTSNNNVSNLEWATHKENEQHAHANGKLVWNSPKLSARLKSKGETNV